METISVYPELNPKVRGNFRFEHICANAKLFADCWRISRVINNNNQVRSLLGVFGMALLFINI